MLVIGLQASHGLSGKTKTNSPLFKKLSGGITYWLIMLDSKYVI